jgi:hypothetical protein
LPQNKQQSANIMSSYKSISGVTFDELIVRINEKFPAAAVKSQFIVGDAFKYLYQVKHLRAAIVSLVLNKLYELDPTIGDAACEMRVLIVHWLREIFLTVRKDGDESVAEAYVKAHAKDKTDTQVRTFADAKGAAADIDIQVRTLGDAEGAEHSDACDELFARVCNSLDEQKIDFLRGCYTFTSSSVMSKDEVGLLFSNRSRAAMAVAGEDTLTSGNQEDLINVERALKANLAYDSIELYLQMYSTLVPRHEAIVPDAPQFFIENQLGLALKQFKSRVTYKFEYAGQIEVEEMPLRAIFPLLASHVLIAYHRNEGILTRARANEMHGLPGAAAGKQLYTDRFGGAYVLLWKPNTATGRYEVVGIDPSNLDDNCTVLDGWTKYLAGADGQGLDASNLAEHEDAFKNVNLAFMVDQYAACHPDFTGNADEKDFDYDEGFEKLCTAQPAGVTFNPTRENFQDLTLNINRPGEKRPNMLNRYTLASQWGEKRTLHDHCQPIHGTGRDQYQRLGRTVDWQIDHIYSMTPRQLLADTKTLTAKFAAAPDHKLGPFLIRAGEGAYSLEKTEDVSTLLKIKNDHKRKAEYVKLVPGNAPLAA